MLYDAPHGWHEAANCTALQCCCVAARYVPEAAALAGCPLAAGRGGAGAGRAARGGRAAAGGRLAGPGLVGGTMGRTVVRCWYGGDMRGMADGLHVWDGRGASPACHFLGALGQDAAAPGPHAAPPACPTPQKFEAYALETCLHVPAGLLANQVRQQGRSCSRNRSGHWLRHAVLQAAPAPSAHPAH